MTYIVPATYSTGQKLQLTEWNHVENDIALLQNVWPAIDVNGANFGTAPTLPQLMGSILQHTSITCDASGMASLSWLSFSNAIVIIMVELINPRQYTVGVTTGSAGVGGCDILVWNAFTNAAASAYTGTANVFTIGY